MIFIKIKICTVFIWAALLIIILSPSQLMANGAAWDPGLNGGMPGPVKQNNLVLNKEKVLMTSNMFSSSVDATFWVFNPTNNPIHEEMGFPLYGDFSSNESIVLDQGQGIKVLVNEKEQVYVVNKNKRSDYQVVINWSMDFPAKSTTIFKVIYPLIPSHSAADIPGMGGTEQYTYGYITHTGGYWAKPIGKATFEFCGKPAQFLSWYPGGSLSESRDNGWQIDSKTVQVSPADYVIDNHRECIVWERQNWIPQKGKDDIQIISNKKSSSYRLSETYDYDKDEYIPVDKYFLNAWCGLKQSGKGEQLSTIVNLSANVLTEEKFKEIIKESYIFAGGDPDRSKGDYENPFYILPEHLSTDYELLLLKYLRNSIFAKYGYQFKDNTLNNCFSKAQKFEGAPNKIENENVRFILQLEKTIKEKNKKAWSKLTK